MFRRYERPIVALRGASVLMTVSGRSLGPKLTELHEWAEAIESGDTSHLREFEATLTEAIDELERIKTFAQRTEHGDITTFKAFLKAASHLHILAMLPESTSTRVRRTIENTIKRMNREMRQEIRRERLASRGRVPLNERIRRTFRSNTGLVRDEIESGRTLRDLDQEKSNVHDQLIEALRHVSERNGKLTNEEQGALVRTITAYVEDLDHRLATETTALKNAEMIEADLLHELTQLKAHLTGEPKKRMSGVKSRLTSILRRDARISRQMRRQDLIHWAEERGRESQVHDERLPYLRKHGWKASEKDPATQFLLEHWDDFTIPVHQTAKNPGSVFTEILPLLAPEGILTPDVKALVLLLASDNFSTEVLRRIVSIVRNKGSNTTVCTFLEDLLSRNDNLKSHAILSVELFTTLWHSYLNSKSRDNTNPLKSGNESHDILSIRKILDLAERMNLSQEEISTFMTSGRARFETIIEILTSCEQKERPLYIQYALYVTRNKYDEGYLHVGIDALPLIANQEDIDYLQYLATESRKPLYRLRKESHKKRNDIVNAGDTILTYDVEPGPATLREILREASRLSARNGISRLCDLKPLWKPLKRMKRFYRGDFVQTKTPVERFSKDTIFVVARATPFGYELFSALDLGTPISQLFDDHELKRWYETDKRYFSVEGLSSMGFTTVHVNDAFLSTAPWTDLEKNLEACQQGPGGYHLPASTIHPNHPGKIVVIQDDGIGGSIGIILASGMIVEAHYTDAWTARDPSRRHSRSATPSVPTHIALKNIRDGTFNELTISNWTIASVFHTHDVEPRDEILARLSLLCEKYKVPLTEIDHRTNQKKPSTVMTVEDALQVLSKNKR